MKKSGWHLREGIKVSLRTKLMVSIIILELLLIGSAILVVERQMQEFILDEFTKRGLSLAKNLAAVNTNYLATYNYVNIEQSVARITKDNDLAYAIVLLFDGEVAAYSGPRNIQHKVLGGRINERALESEETLVQYDRLDSPGQEVCDISVPIFLKGEKWGTARVGFSLNDMHAAILKTRASLFALGAIVLMVSCLCCMVLARRITRPICTLVKSVEAISNGEYEQEIRITTRDEIAYLGKRFAAMQETLKEQIQLLTDTNRELACSNQRLQSLFEVSQTMNSLQNQEKLYDLILEAALTASGGALGASLTLYDQDQGIRTVSKALSKDSKGNSMEHTAREVLKERTLERYHSFTANPGTRPLLAQLEPFQQGVPIFSMRIESNQDIELLFIPLQQADILMGFINLVREKKEGSVSDPTIQTLSVLASHATASLENKKLFVELEEAYLSSIKSLVKTLEFKDEYTYGHAERVARICMNIGKRMNIEENGLKVLYNAALLHDIGKIGIMESILNKKTDLDPNEWSKIKQHPVAGEEILRPILSLREECKIVRHHHEREDGRGYPDGLYGSRLSLSEKIIIVADAFDAMNSKRAYRSALNLGDIKHELQRNKGSQFDEEVVDVFMEVLDEEAFTRVNSSGSGRIIPFSGIHLGDG
jgi:HD-GYP domain-containing protein (c-di-GMP phosphodiesterase class II)